MYALFPAKVLLKVFSIQNSLSAMRILSVILTSFTNYKILGNTRFAGTS